MSLFSSLGRFLTGSRGRTRQMPRFTGAQTGALDTLLQRGMSDTDVSGLEQRYRRLYERDTVPGMAQRFTSMGGGQRSSGFQESLRRGGLDLSEQLANLRHRSGMQSLGFGLQPRFDYLQEPGSQGLLGGMGGSLLGLATGGLGGLIGGSFGRAMGNVSRGMFGQEAQNAPQQRARVTSSGSVPMPGGGEGVPATAEAQQPQGELAGLLGQGLGGLLGAATRGQQIQEQYMPGQPIGMGSTQNQMMMRLMQGINFGGR